MTIMKHKLSATLGLVISMMSPFVTSTAGAQTVSPGSYLADASWDQTLACPTLDNCPRFTVLSNMNSAAVLDRQTGLVWERSPSSSNLQFADGQAAAHCTNLSLGNRKGWRVPTLQEFASLVDADPANTTIPKLPPGHPFQRVQLTAHYWAATLATPDGVFVWTEFLFDGTQSGEISIASFPVWCVRGGSGRGVQ